MKILLRKQIYLDTFNVSDLEILQCEFDDIFNEFTYEVENNKVIVRYVTEDTQSFDDNINIFEQYFNQIYRKFLLGELMRVSDKMSFIKNKISNGKNIK